MSFQNFHCLVVIEIFSPVPLRIQTVGCEPEGGEVAVFESFINLGQALKSKI